MINIKERRLVETERKAGTLSGLTPVSGCHRQEAGINSEENKLSKGWVKEMS